MHLGIAMKFDEGTGQETYVEDGNPYLVTGLSSSTDLGRSQPEKQRRDNGMHATAAASAKFVAALNRVLGNGYSLAPAEEAYGGTGRAGYGRVVWSEPMQLIARPDGTTFPAGLIGQVLGNDSEWASWRSKSWAICTQFLQVPYVAPAQLRFAPGETPRELSEVLAEEALPAPATAQSVAR